MITRLPIITLNECIHHTQYVITARHICTLDLSRRRGTCLGDEGGPLVYDNRLLGVLLYAGNELGENADIFLNIHDADQQEWVIAMRNYYHNHQ